MSASHREILAETPLDAILFINQEPERGRVGLLVTCCAVNFLYAVYFGAIGALLPAVGLTFVVGAAAQGRLFPANFAGMIASVLISGTLSDRFGRRVVLLGGVALFGTGLLLFGMAPGFGLALLAAPLIGAGSGGMVTVANALVSDLFPERRAALLNLTQIMFGVGAAVGPTLAKSLLSAGVGWRFLYQALALAMLGAFLAIWFQPAPRGRSASGAIQWSDLRDLLRQPAFGILCVSQGLYAGAEVGFFQWMPTYFQTLAGGATWSGIVVSVFWVSMTIGRIITGSLMARLPLLSFGITLALCSALSATCALLAGSPLVILAFVALTGLFFSGIYSVILAEAAHRFAHRAGTVFGGIAALAGIGCALSPWAVGAVGASPLGWRVGIGLSPLLALCVAGNLFFLKKKA